MVLEACKDLKSIGLWTAKKLLQWQPGPGLRREGGGPALFGGQGSSLALSGGRWRWSWATGAGSIRQRPPQPGHTFQGEWGSSLALFRVGDMGGGAPHGNDKAHGRIHQ